MCRPVIDAARHRGRAVTTEHIRLLHSPRATVKRCIDIVGAAGGLLLLGPMLGLTAALVRGRLGKPVLFVQKRPGLGGKPFPLYKFRTMRDAVGADGRPLPDSERLTDVGRWLRASSLDELPELINVLRGDMSLVGPRPLLMHYLPLYSPEQSRRHLVRPGLTGLAQVRGRNAVSWDEKFKQDLWYVDNWSLWLDFCILVRTVTQVIRRQGISQSGHATMEAFEGSPPVG
jgi:sugar transferase EpsL